jgi:hypothetical protein
MKIRRTLAAVTAALAIATVVPTGAATGASDASTAFAPTVVKYANCAALNRVYRHGVGRKGARDHVSGSSQPVRNFTVNTAVYAANTGRDRDKDGIACEKL